MATEQFSERNDKIVELYIAGLSYQAIADLIGATKGVVAGAINRRRGDLPKRVRGPLTAQVRVERAAVLYNAGADAKTIALTLGVEQRSAFDILRRAAQRGYLTRAAPPKRKRRKSPFNRLPPPKSKNSAPYAALEVGAAAESNPVTIFNLRSHHCRWPLWGAERGLSPFEKFYCGAVKDDGSVYCAFHRAASIGQGSESERSAVSWLERMAR